jgi:hypothetical protein
MIFVVNAVSPKKQNMITKAKSSLINLMKDPPDQKRRKPPQDPIHEPDEEIGQER